MAVVDQDLIMYGSNSMPDDDTATGIGGAILTSRKMDFSMFLANQTVQYISSAAGDTTQTITVSYLDNSLTLRTETKTLNGTTVVAGSATMNTLLKAIKSATTTGDVAVESTTARKTGTAQAGAATSITLDAGASAVDDFYKDMVVRITSGTGSGQIREIFSYVGSTKVANVSRAWGTNPDATSVFRVSDGFLFDKSPVEITEVRRIFYNTQANAAGGGAKTYYDKIFLKNTNGASNASAASIVLSSNPSGDVTFGLPATLNDSGSNGGGNNRQIAPSGITFDTTTKAVPTNVLTSGDAIGIWVKLTLPAGSSPAETLFTLGLQGTV